MLLLHPTPLSFPWDQQWLPTDLRPRFRILNIALGVLHGLPLSIFWAQIQSTGFFLPPYPANILVSIFSFTDSPSIFNDSPYFLSLFPHESNFIFLDFSLHFFFYSLTTYRVDLLSITSFYNCSFFINLVESSECNCRDFLEACPTSHLHLVACAGKCNREIKHIWSIYYLFQDLFSKWKLQFKATYKQLGHYLLIRIFFSLSEYQRLTPYLLFGDTFDCLVFFFFRMTLGFVQLFLCSRCPLFTRISSVYFTCCCFAWITASFGHSSSTVNSTFHVFLFFPWEFSFLLHPSFLAGLFTWDRNTRSHSNSAERLAEVPNQAFCDVTFLSYLAGHENGKLGSHFKINIPCSQPLSQEYEM